MKSSRESALDLCSEIRFESIKLVFYPGSCLTFTTRTLNFSYISIDYYDASHSMCRNWGILEFCHPQIPTTRHGCLCYTVDPLHNEHGGILFELIGKQQLHRFYHVRY